MKQTLLPTFLVVGFFYLCLVMYEASADLGSPEPVTFDKPISEVQLHETPEVTLIPRSEIECLAKNIYFEAGNQTLEGKKAVGTVTINRMKHSKYSDTICEVITETKRDYNGNIVKNKCQFSWYCDGKPDEPNLANLDEKLMWLDSLHVANGLLDGTILPDEKLMDSTHYHANYVSPRWSKSKRMAYRSTIGDHIFYKEHF